MKVAKTKEEAEAIKAELHVDDNPNILQKDFQLLKKLTRKSDIDFLTLTKEIFGSFDEGVNYILRGYAKGKTDAWMRTELGITQRRHYTWLKTDEIYNAIIGFGRDLCQRYLEEQADIASKMPASMTNTGMLIFMLKKFPMYATQDFLRENPYFNQEPVNLEGADTKRLEKYLRDIDSVLYSGKDYHR